MKARLAHLTGGRAGETAVIWKSCAMLGRSSQADVRFGPEGDRMVAGRHAALTWHEGVWSVRDLGSVNGTFVDGSRVHGETALRDGSIIQLGHDGPQVRFSVLWEEGAPEPVRTVDVDAMDDPDAFRTLPHTPVILSRPDRDEQMPAPPRRVRHRVVALALGATVLGGITLARAGSDNAPDALRERLLARADSVFAALEATPFDNPVMLSAISETESRVVRLRGRVRIAPSDPVALTRLRDSMDALAARQQRLASAAALDDSAVLRAGAHAIGVVEARLADGRRVLAPAFAARSAEGRVRFVTGAPEIALAPDIATLRLLLRGDSTGIPMRVVSRHERRRITVLAPEGARAAGTAVGPHAPFPAAGEPALLVEATPAGDRATFVTTQSAVTAVVGIEHGVARLEQLGVDAAPGSALFDRHGALVGIVLPAEEGYGVRAVPLSTLLDPSDERRGG